LYRHGVPPGGLRRQKLVRHARRDLPFLPRIRADDDNLVQWFGDYLQVNYELRYVSDGNPDFVTVPNTLPPDLADQLAPAKVGGRQIVRYGP
jgi:hypothetical protein